MGSAQTTECSPPESSNNRDNQSTRNPMCNAATQYSSPYNSTTQQQSTNNATSRGFNNFTTSTSTTQQRYTNDDIDWELNKSTKLKSAKLQQQSTNDATSRGFNNFTTSTSTTQQRYTNDDIDRELNKSTTLKSVKLQRQSTNDATSRGFNNFTTSTSTTQQRYTNDDIDRELNKSTTLKSAKLQRQSTNDATSRELNRSTTLKSTTLQRQSSESNNYESHNLIKETNSFSEVMTKKLGSYNNAKETSLAEGKSNNTETLAVPIKKKNFLEGIIKPPEKLNNLDDFIKNWNIWKEQLISFLILMDEKKQNYNQWGHFFLYFMGPFAQEILNELFFNNEEDKKDYQTLLQKYNAFHKFYTTLKSKNENTVEYIEKLKREVAQNFKSVDITIKNKIAQEIKMHCKERFVALAKSKLPQFKFETTFESLTLAEIGFLWKFCEESNFDSNRNCIYCGNFHPEEECPALDKECSKCKRRGHVATHCPGLMYITNCSYCGGNHKYKCCPSYGETCSKCGCLDHFSWKCPKIKLVKNCRYCGLSHFMFRNACPAKNSLCSICKERGHYDIKCTKI